MFTAGFPGSPRDETAAAKRIGGPSRLRACRAADAAADCGRRASGGAGELRRADRSQQRYSALVSFAGRGRACESRAVRRGRGRAVPRLQPSALGQADGAVGASARRLRARSSVCPSSRSASGITCASSPADSAKERRSKTATSASSLPFRSARRSCARSIYSRNSFVARSSAAASRLAPRPFPARRAAAAVRPRRVHDGRSDRPHARVDVPAARPLEHGAFARGAGAVPVASLCRVRTDRANRTSS